MPLHMIWLLQYLEEKIPAMTERPLQQLKKIPAFLDNPTITLRPTITSWINLAAVLIPHERPVPYR
jgi:hypothetical protein